MSRIDSNSAFDTGTRSAREKAVDHTRQEQREDVREQRTTAQQMINNLVPNRGNSARTSEATTPQQNTQPPTQPTAQPTANRDQATAPRQEVQQEGTRTQAQQQAFQEAGAASRNLNQLSTSRTQPQSGTRPATQEAVISKNQAADAHIQQNSQASTFTPSQAMNRVPHAQTKAGAEAATRFIDPNNNAKVTRDQAAENRPQQTVQPGTQTATPQAVRDVAQSGNLQFESGSLRETGEDTDSSEGVSRRQGRGQTSQSGRAAVTGRTSSPERDRLESLISGNGGGQDGGFDDAHQTDATPPVISGPIPEFDASTRVFNEFDSERPGHEVVLARRNVFTQFVLKERLREIATFNESLDQQFKAIFGTPFSERVEGDLIKASDCLRNLRG